MTHTPHAENLDRRQKQLNRATTRAYGVNNLSVCEATQRDLAFKGWVIELPVGPYFLPSRVFNRSWAATVLRLSREQYGSNVTVRCAKSNLPEYA